MALYVTQSKRLWLQALDVDEHFQDFKRVLNDPRGNIWAVTNQKKFFNDEEALEFMRSSLASAEKPWVRRWAILLRPSPESSDNTSANIEDRDSKPRMIGLVGIVRPAEIGYKIHPDFWGKGYMSEALELCIKLFWASKENNAHDKLLAAADPENKASTRLLEKFGFQKAEYKENFYERELNGEVIKCHMQCFYLERPVKQ